MSHQIVPVRVYVLVWLALTILTFATWGIAVVDLGAWNIVVAITIAVIKMLLVIIFFMHVKQANNLTRLFVFAGFFWMMILFLLTLSDYHSRDWMPLGHMW